MADEKQTYEVTASILTTPERRYRKGEFVELTAEQAEHALAAGGVKVPGQDEEPAAELAEGGESGEGEPADDSGADDGAGADAGGGAKPPAQSEPKAAFVAYAVDHLGLDRDGAEAMSKAELVELTRQ